MASVFSFSRSATTRTCILLVGLCAHTTAAPSALSPLLSAPYIPPPSRTVAASPADIFVNCKYGSDASTGRSPTSPLRTIAAALAKRRGATSGTIHIAGGLCALRTPVTITRNDSGVSAAVPLVLRGDGRTTLSGGVEVPNFVPITWPGAPAASVWQASVPQWGDGDEIKIARIGATQLNRSRWPPIVGDGLSTRNFLFTQPWSSGTADPHGHRSLQHLGVDPSTLPTGADLAAVAGIGFVNVLGCIERDVNSQLTRIESVELQSNGSGKSETPTLGVLFRNSFQVNQRFSFENVPWALAPGNFIHDSVKKTLTVWLDDRDSAFSSSSSSSSAELAAPPPRVIVPSPGMDTLVSIDGAKHVVLSNLTFADLTYYADGFWDGPAQQPSDAAIRINRAVDVVIEASNFVASLGGGSVAIGNATNESSVVGCLVDGVGQGGVIMFGYDAPPNMNVPAHSGAVVGVNTQPRHIRVEHNVMHNLGTVLVHVGGAVLRSASNCVIAHNRISKTTRYAIQADSFYTLEGGGPPNSGLNSHSNVVEYNILSDTCRSTTDAGAIEMLGSGDPANDNQVGKVAF